MEFIEVVVKRRSVRRFKEDPIGNGVIERILDAGRWAPSAGNSQPWRFVVITEIGIKKGIAENSTRFSKEAWRNFPAERARYLAEHGGSWDKSVMARVPVLVAVCFRPVENIRDELIPASVWMAVQNILLASTDEGLGSCVYTFYDTQEEDRIRETLRVPKDYRVACLIQLGHGKTTALTPSRKPLNEIVSYQHF
jgi:iodotyrosine deiodinase